MKISKTFSSLVTAVLLLLSLPTTALAHPGHLGAITHLGPQTIFLTVLAAAIDSFNPTALGVLLLLITAQQRVSESIVGTFRVGLLYILGIVITYLLAGYGINLFLIQSGPSLFTEGLQILLAFFLFVVGLREIDSIFSKKTWFPWADKLVGFLLEKIGPATASVWPFFLGLFFGLIELFLTGAIYLSFIRGITYDPTGHAGILAAFVTIYLFVFTLPLFVAVYFSGIAKAFSIEGGKSSKAVLAFRAMVGLIFIAVAVWLTVVSLNLLRTL